MIGTDYNSNWAFSPMGPGFAASTQAMRALTAYSDATYGGNTNSIMDVVSLGDPFRTSYDDAGAMKELSRRLALLRQMGGNAPADLLSMPTDQFLNLVTREASALKAQSAPSTAKNGNKNGNKDAAQNNSSPLTVKGHDKYDAEGNRIPVVSETVSEAGNWSSRENTYNPSGLNEADATYNRAKLGGYYNVTVTWADGSSTTKQVLNKGYAIDIWG